MNRRRFAFWLGFGLFSLADRLGLNSLDALAATLSEKSDDSQKSASSSKAEHWAVESNKKWWWYERQNLVDGQWVTTGITTPIDKKTGELLTGKSGYLDPSVVPEEVRVAGWADASEAQADTSDQMPDGQPDPERRARHGRPPSKWLRSLHAEEIRIWLKTIDVPAAGVSGMTFWTHLTKDHSFDAEKIDGLTIDEQAQLHAAAHYGY